MPFPEQENKFTDKREPCTINKLRFKQEHENITLRTVIKYEQRKHPEHLYCAVEFESGKEELEKIRKLETFVRETEELIYKGYRHVGIKSVYFDAEAFKKKYGFL